MFINREYDISDAQMAQELNGLLSNVFNLPNLTAYDRVMVLREMAKAGLRAQGEPLDNLQAALIQTGTLM